MVYQTLKSTTCRNTYFCFGCAREIYCFFEYLLWIMGKRFVNKWPDGWPDFRDFPFFFDYLGLMVFSSSTLIATSTVNNDESYKYNVVIIEICSPQKHIQCWNIRIWTGVRVTSIQLSIQFLICKAPAKLWHKQFCPGHILIACKSIVKSWLKWSLYLTMEGRHKTLRKKEGVSIHLNWCQVYIELSEDVETHSL